jgi:hypothetical protein
MWRRSITVLSTKEWMIINHTVDDYHIRPSFDAITGPAAPIVNIVPL